MYYEASEIFAGEFWIYLAKF